MRQAGYWILLILKILLFLLLLPVFLLWMVLKYLRYRSKLVRNLAQCGIPRAEARKMAGDMNPVRLLRN